MSILHHFPRPHAGGLAVWRPAAYDGSMDRLQSNLLTNPASLPNAADAPVAVLIADDHPLFRDALAQIVSSTLPHARIVECGSLEDAQSALAAREFELVLLDVNMPGMNGMAGLLALRNLAPATPVVIVSGREDRDTVDQAMGCGAAGFIPKSLSRDGMAAAISAVLAGEISLPQDAPLDGLPERHAAVAALSSQQRRVLEMISAGKANKIIAYELSISESTVKAHVTAILRKLNLRSRIQAALYATRQG